MVLVIENLKLATYGRACSLIQLWVNEILDTAIGSFGDFEVDFKDEVLICLAGDDIASVC